MAGLYCEATIGYNPKVEAEARGDAEAQQLLCVIHSQGGGGPAGGSAVLADAAEALRWCELAAAQGHPEVARGGRIILWTRLIIFHY